MGRSGGGGGFHGGGGGFSHRSGGGGFHHSGGGYHHHHSGYHHSYGGGGYYSSNGCNICAIPIFIILVVIMVIIILCSSPGVSYSTTLTQCEQYVVCPSSLSKGEMDFSCNGGHVTAYLLPKLPSSTEQANTTILHVSGNTLSSGSYVFNSFNLVKGSRLTWDISGNTFFHFYLIDGYDEYKKFKNYDTFHYVKSSYSSHASGSYTATYSDEFFAVIDAEYFVSISSHDYVVDHTRYDVSTAIDKSYISHTFKVPDSYVDTVCLIVEMPCDAPSSADTDIEISFDLDRGTVFWVCLGLAVLFGVGVLAAIGACIYCTVKKKTGTTGTTYQTVPSSSAQAPSYPASYQQPQDPAAYSTTTPVYATAGGVDPAAPVPAYNPSVGVDPTYGTMPTATVY